MAKHIAFKCTYNNGGEGRYVGFSGTCTEDQIKQNIRSHVWCRQNENFCKQYYDRGFKGDPPLYPCYESELFAKWKFGAGRFHTGIRAGEPIHANQVGEDKIAIMTTRFPGEYEKDRKIIGLFKIGKITNKPDEETILYADDNYRIRLPLDEASELYFWDYYSTKGGAKWGTGLFRYLTDEQVSSILRDLIKTIRNDDTKLKIISLLNSYAGMGSVVEPSGPRIKTSGDRTKRLNVKRKYGSGGEGAEHKSLKEWVANNPNEIGLSNVQKVDLEYSFISGDTVDVVFTLPGGRFVVVEVETDIPLPGCHQALKYRTLKCAEEGFPIDSENVQAVMVAWHVPAEVKKFCNKYNITALEKRL